MDEAFSSFDKRLAKRVNSLRTNLGLSIEDLAARSGVSRAMISRIERAESSPTAVVLNKLSIGLGVLLPTLFGESTYRVPRGPNPVATRREQPVWRDPGTGYVRRTLTPTGSEAGWQLSEIHFPAGARVTFENAFGPVKVRQQIWLLSGAMEIRLGVQVQRLTAGDCMSMTLDQPITFRNTGKTAARYLVAICSQGKEVR